MIVLGELEGRFFLKAASNCVICGCIASKALFKLVLDICCFVDSLVIRGFEVCVLSLVQLLPFIHLRRGSDQCCVTPRGNGKLLMIGAHGTFIILPVA